MKFIKNYSRITGIYFIGRKNNFYFNISCMICGFYVWATHKTKDIRFNSLWSKKTFETVEQAQEFCETFDYKKENCLGKDL